MSEFLEVGEIGFSHFCSGRMRSRERSAAQVSAGGDLDNIREAHVKLQPDGLRDDKDLGCSILEIPLEWGRGVQATSLYQPSLFPSLFQNCSY